MVTAESLSSLLMAAMREAVLIEREACALIAMKAPPAPYDETEKLYRAGWEDAVTHICAAIRDRT